ncbi:MAG: NAD-dependent epimerase/dehydratase family protein [Mycobacterium kyogaense]|uniref:NAD-dependent epimerase/dehydratase family protein n=1 Tax=Mycobacterium kyogaense TaxID=2212479 RepID=UPI002FFD4546
MSIETPGGGRHIVVGSASEIGEALAVRLLDSGAEVIGIDHGTSPASVSTCFDIDLSNEDQIDACLGRIDGTFDGLTYIASAPSIADPARIVTVNALALRHICESLYERLNPGACVTIVVSTAAIDWPTRLPLIDELLAAESIDEGLRWFADHSADLDAASFSEEVATVYAQAMGLVLATLGVRINAVLCGPGPSTVSADDDDFTRVLTPCGVADAIVALQSGASRWINGHALVVDGGVTGAALTGVIRRPRVRSLGVPSLSA